MAVVLHQMGRDPLHLFDGNAFYPYSDTLAFSEHLFVPALLGSPIALLTQNLVLAYNVVVLLTLAIAAFGMWLLAREICHDGAASVAAGLLYAFHTWNQNELVRLQILSNEFFPYVLWALLRFFSAPTPRRALVFAVFYLLQSLSCMYWALYLPLLVGAAFLALEWRHRLSPARLLPLAVGLTVALVLTLPFALPYLETARQLGFERPIPDSLKAERYFQVLPENLLYGKLLSHALPNQNAAHFLGFLALALGAWGCLRPSPLRGLLCALFVAGVALSLGPRIEFQSHDLGPGPYMLLRHFVPGFRNVRYPERLSLVAVLGLCPLVSLGLRRLRALLGTAGVLLLGGFVFAEHLSLPQPLSYLPTGSAIPEVYRYLASQPEIHVVAHLPATSRWLERADAMPMYFSTVHWKRIPEGFTSYWPPTYNFVKWRLFHVPSEESLSFLRRFGVDTLIVEPTGGGVPGWIREDARWSVRGPFPEGHVALALKGPFGEGFGTTTEDRDLVEVSRAGWRVDGSAPGADLAIDDDSRTAWLSGPEQHQGDFFRVRFPEPVVVARISMNVRSFETRSEDFPTHFEVSARTAGAWSKMPYDVELCYDRFFSRLLSNPSSATLDVDVAPAEATAIRIRVTADEPFLMPFALSEIRVYTRRNGHPGS